MSPVGQCTPSGGSILSQLLGSDDEAIENSQLSVLVRGAARAKAFSEVGVNPILFNSLDETEVLEKAASEHDSKPISTYHQVIADGLCQL